MSIVTRSILFVAGAGLIGAVVGQSQILCPDGQCMITGSWFGGGFVGSAFGYAAAGLIPMRVVTDDAEDDAADAD